MTDCSQTANEPDVAPVGASPPWRLWVTAWMVSAVFMLSNTATPLYVHWQREIGFSAGTLTAVFSAYMVGLLAALLVAGQLSDRFGRKPVLIPGIGAALAACALFATASSVTALITARLLSGAAVGVAVSAGMASVADVGGPERKRQAALAASVSMVLGAGLGPLLAGAMAEGLDDPVVPVFSVEFLVLASALVVALSLPGGSAPARPRRHWRLRLPGIPAANRLHVGAGVAVFAPGITATSFVLSLGPSLLAELLMVDSPLVAGLTACVMFATATGVQFALKGLPPRTIFRLGCAATMLSMAGLVAAINASVALLLVLAAVLAGAGQGLGQLGGLTLIGLHVPADRRAEANAVLNIGGYIPAGLLPVCAGYLIDVAGLPAGTAAFAFSLATAAGAAAVFVSTRLAGR